MEGGSGYSPPVNAFGSVGIDGEAFSSGVLAKTTARSGMAGSEVTADDDTLVATITEANPPRLVLAVI